MAPTATATMAGDTVAKEILRAGRRDPVVVVSQNRHAPEAVIDAKGLERDLKGIAAVLVLDDTAAHGLAGLLPPQAGVYGNAARVYEPHALAGGAPPRFRPRVAFDRRSAEAAALRAMDDALGCAAKKAAGTGTTPDPGPRTVTVRGFIPDGHALATAEDGALVTINADNTLPGIPPEWYLAVGQRVTGIPLPEGMIDIAPALIRHRLSLVYRPGSTVLALARNITASTAELTLFPGSTWTVPVPEGVAEEGEVVCALYYHESGAVRLSLTEAAEHPTAEAPPLLAEGPPWLALGRSLPKPLPAAQGQMSPPDTEPDAAPPDAPAPTRAADAPPAAAAEPEAPGTRDPDSSPTSPSVGAAQPPEAEDPAVPEVPSTEAASDRREAPGPVPAPQAGRVHTAHDAQPTEAARARMASQLATALQEGTELKHQLDRADQEIRRLRTEVGGLKKKLKALARTAAAEPQRELFADPFEGLRHEIYTTWARYVLATDKDRYPAPSRYWIGPDLPATLDASAVAGDRRSKALETIVDILIRREERWRTLSIKPLCTKKTKQKQLQRWDGALAWRARIENNTPAALRLHYWSLPDGSFEISTVNIHDDYPNSASGSPGRLVP
ncbi:hypothetical protein [Sinomonas humi]|uniref:Uncharacterized protein n=1 Tax=Sinomonas humi TaxID=1338436 RepID=A0A0B2ARA8_9MICC|nr:hypothetical protein [Sinomonas humi]KHL04499.1 hypothetical protein LK10_05015 [Sinomonas humi]